MVIVTGVVTAVTAVFCVNVVVVVTAKTRAKTEYARELTVEHFSETAGRGRWTRTRGASKRASERCAVPFDYRPRTKTD